MARRGTLTLRREDGRIVCEHVEVAATLPRRVRGLIGRRALPRGTGIVLRPAFSIHTSFLRFPIDVVFLDHEQVVMSISHDVRPWGTATCRGAREVVELAGGECARRGLEVGDRVAWAARPTFEEAIAADGDEPGSMERLRRGDVLLASNDRRYVRYARFLLDGRGIGVVDSVAPRRAADAVERLPVGVLVLDAGDAVADTMRLASATRTRNPETDIVLVGEGAAERSPTSVRIFDKWNETDALLSAIETALDRRVAR
jgi:uncharacterized membrane protein (UPF0127 family)